MKRDNSIDRTVLDGLTLTHGVGSLDKHTACTISALNLAMTGVLTDSRYECMDPWVHGWVIPVQDRVSLDVLNGPEWRQLMVGIAGTADMSGRRQIVLDAMWEALAWVTPGGSWAKEWAAMLADRTADAARAARATAAYTAAYAADAAAYATAAYARAAATAADDAAYAYARAAAYAAADAAAAAAYAARAAANAAAYARGAAYAADAAAYAADAAAYAARFDAWAVGTLRKLVTP